MVLLVTWLVGGGWGISGADKKRALLILVIIA